MESINEDTIVSSQSSPEYMSPSEYPARNYYAMQTEESAPNTWNTPMMGCEPTEMDITNKSKDTLSATIKLNKKLQQKIKSEAKHELIGIVAFNF